MKSIRLGPYQFRPALWPSLLCGILIVLFIQLGHWQWGRANYKQDLMERYQQGLSAKPLESISEIVSLGKDLQGYPATFEGFFPNEKVVLLDNQVRDRVAGFHVLSPLAVKGQGVILVNRGWLAGNLDRSLPKIPLLREGILTIQGKIYFPSKKQFVLKEDEASTSTGPLLIQKLDLPAISRGLGVELAPFVLRADPGEIIELGEQMPRDWQFIVMSAEKSRAYSFQWFAMALALLILYGIFSTEKTCSTRENTT